jgi:hypothetical protein
MMKHPRETPAMNGKYYYADVDLPFHVWVRESGRWVLREAPGLEGGTSSDRPSAPRMPPRNREAGSGARPSR